MLTLLLAVLQDATIYRTTDADAAAIYLSLDIPRIPQALEDYIDGGPGGPAEIRKALLPFEGTLSRIHEAARAKRCAWTYPGREKYGDIPHLLMAVSASRLLAARVRLRLETGDFDGALDDAFAGWGVGIHYLSDGPVMTSLIGIISLTQVEHVLRTALPGKTLDPARLKRLGLHAEEAVAAYPTFRRAMEAEKRLALGSVDDAVEDFHGLIVRLEGVGGRTSKAEKKDERRDTLWKRVQDLLHADRAASRKALRKRVEEVWEDVLHDADQPIGSKALRVDYAELKRRPVEKWTRFERDGDPQMGLEAAADMYVALVLPALERAKPNFAIGRLSLGLRALWCGVELREREGGRYPESLDGLRPALVDPWDGKGVKYRRIEEDGRRGFVLTAAGPKGDWEERIRKLEQCGFNLEKFDGLGSSESDSTGWTVWQVRR